MRKEGQQDLEICVDNAFWLLVLIFCDVSSALNPIQILDLRAEIV